MRGKTVGVIMGGSLSESEVSLRSGEAVVDALSLHGHQVVPIRFDHPTQLIERLQRQPIDVAFIALHGRFGEDGCVQGLLEALGIPYTGSSVLSSALAMDKLKSKELFRLHNVPTPPYYSIGREELARLDDLHGSFGYPVVVKPRREGSSVGVSLVNSATEFRQAVEAALQCDDAVLVERFVRGKEVAVGILNGRVLGAIEISPKGELYDYHAKYEAKDTEYHLPARLPEARYQGVLNLAERAAKCLDCDSAVRVDLLVTDGGNEYVLEVNTLPGMTATSLLPKIAAAAGYDMGLLCETILAGARLDVGSAKPTAAKPLLAGEPMRVAV